MRRIEIVKSFSESKSLRETYEKRIRKSKRSHENYKRSRVTRAPVRSLMEIPTVTSDRKTVNMQRNYLLRKLHGKSVRNKLPFDNAMGKVIWRCNQWVMIPSEFTTRKDTPQGKVTRPP